MALGSVAFILAFRSLTIDAQDVLLKPYSIFAKLLARSMLSTHKIVGPLNESQSLISIDLCWLWLICKPGIFQARKMHVNL